MEEVDNRTLSMPETRGMSMARERASSEEPYTAASYAAQYGITVGDAVECGAKEEAGKPAKSGMTHGQVKRIILGMLARDIELREKAMNIE